MPQPNNVRKPGGFAALYEVQERLRRERESRSHDIESRVPTSQIESTQTLHQAEPPLPPKLTPVAVHNERPETENSSADEVNQPSTNSLLPASSQLAGSSQPLQSSQPPASQLPASSQLADVQDGSSPSWQLPQSSQLATSRQPRNLVEPHVDLIAGLPQVKGHLRLPNQLVDHLLPQLDPFEQAVYIQLFRLSWGFNKPTCSISLPKLVERSRIPLSTLKKVVGRLQAKGLIQKTNILLGYGKEQGIEYRVLPASSQLGESSQPPQSSQLAQTPIKKNININTHNTGQTSSKSSKEIAAQSGVGVGSRFSLEDCRSYAQHLHQTAQGITNPGGYATKIHRTGEADESIASFLKPAPIENKVDVSQCPDCQGTGYYYPRGTEHGVARCKHERLTNAPEASVDA